MNRRLTVECNGKQVEGFAQIVKGKLWVHFQGQTFVQEAVKTGRLRRASEGKSSTAIIHAPMPGKVTKILAEIGNKVAVGQAVLVMEAMKMEYTLKSELDTTVEKIMTKVGEQVQLGQALVKLKE